MQYIPPAPVAPPKKSRGKAVLLTVLATVGILAVIGSLIDDDVSSTNASPAIVEPTLSEDTSLEIVRLAWDMELTASERADICDYYNTSPVGTTPEMVEVFADGAEIPYDEADRLLDQLLAEEC